MRGIMGKAMGVLVAGAMLVAQSGAFGQEQEVAAMGKEAHPSFEVATIKPSQPEDQSAGFHESGRQLFIENETVESMIAIVYGLQAKQIVDVPDWCTKDHWDIKGVPDEAGQPNWPQYREMVRKLLEERFGLKFHREKRELSIFAMTVAKGGSKLVASKGEMNGMLDQTGSNNGVEQSWKYTNNTMEDFAQGMQDFLDRPVVDETGLKGKFDFRLEWTGDGAVNPDPKAPPGLFTAVQEQLGLKIEPTKGPAEVLVVERVERPSAN
jgi:uncharacterized protein (TIGR03435 family)